MTLRTDIFLYTEKLSYAESAQFTLSILSLPLSNVFGEQIIVIILKAYMPHTPLNLTDLILEQLQLR